MIIGVERAGYQTAIRDRRVGRRRAAHAGAVIESTRRRIVEADEAADAVSERRRAALKRVVRAPDLRSRRVHD